MALDPGSRLGPYEIDGLIGSGGMGEVYAATDPRLRRTVAIKVLPVGTNSDRLAVARLRREAQAVAALNHPNICSIFDIGDSDGGPFLVMERLDGETLAARLTRGLLDLGGAVDIGIALADALAAAHRAGVIHRDIKPSNIFLTERGTPKVLDFGLATAIAPGEMASTVSETHTGPGALAGTVMYMAPEQLRGDLLDARADIFSLGLVLYEMITGKPAFVGATPAMIATAILTRQATPPRVLRPQIPSELERIVLKALDKDREFRYQSVADLGSDLRRFARERNAGAAAPAPSVYQTDESPSGPTANSTVESSDRIILQGLLRRHLVAVVAVLVTLAILIAGLVAWQIQTTASITGGTASPTLSMRALSFSGDIRNAAISADRRFVSFVRNDAVWVRQVSAPPGERDIQLVAPSPGRTYQHPTFTPTGEHVDFIVLEHEARELWRVPLLGGAPQRMLRNVWSGIGWSPDGRTMAFMRGQPDMQSSAVLVANTDGSNERVIAHREAPLTFVTVAHPGGPASRPSWSPDGRQLLVIGVNFGLDGREPFTELVYLDPIQGRPLQVRRTEKVYRQATWLSSSRLILEDATAFFFTTLGFGGLEGDNWTPLSRQVAELYDFVGTSDRRAGVAIRLERRTGIWAGDSAGQNFRNVLPEDDSGMAFPYQDVSGNLFFSALLNDGRTGIFRVAANTGERTLLTDRLAGFEHWSVSRDGKVVVFTGRDSPFPLFRINADGSGLVKLVEKNAAGPTLTADGQTVLFSQFGPAGLLSVSIDGGNTRTVSKAPVETAAIVSPDGQRIAFRSGSPEAMLICERLNCDHPISVKLATTSEFTPVRWTPTGDALAFVKAEDPTNIWVQPISGGAPRQLTRLTERRIAEFSWSADGSRLLLCRGGLVTNIVLLEGIH